MEIARDVDSDPVLGPFLSQLDQAPKPHVTGANMHSLPPAPARTKQDLGLLLMDSLRTVR